MSSEIQGRSDNLAEGSEGGSVAILLFPDSLEIELRPRFAGTNRDENGGFYWSRADGSKIPHGATPERLGALWHRTEDDATASLILRNLSGNSKSVLVYLDAPSYGIAQSWFRLSFDRVENRELAGGAAVAAQDRAFPGSRAGILFFPAPDDRQDPPSREAQIVFEPTLDGQTKPGIYEFRVLVTDISDCLERTGKPIDEWIRQLESAANPHRELRGFASQFPTQETFGQLKLKHPESRLLNALPSLYREALTDLQDRTETANEPSFFERYLLGFEDIARPLERTLSSLERLFGAFATTPDFLLQLGAWVCMPLDENLDEIVRRKLVAEAVELFRWRGTRRGLMRYLQILTGAIPEIDDQPVEGMRLGAHAKLGTDQTVLGDIAPHTFVVTLPVPDPTKFSEPSLIRVIESFKPAHTTFKFRMVSL